MLIVQAVWPREYVHRTWTAPINRDATGAATLGATVTDGGNDTIAGLPTAWVTGQLPQPHTRR
jgi:hypothetical protein